MIAFGMRRLTKIWFYTVLEVTVFLTKKSPLEAKATIILTFCHSDRPCNFSYISTIEKSK